MKIFYASQSFYPHVGGVSTYLLNLLRELQNKGEEVKELHLRLPGMETTDDINKIDIARIPKDPIKKELIEGYSKFKENFQKAILCQKNDFNPDVYEMQGFKEFFDINKAFGEEVSQLLESNPAEVVHVHDFQLVFLYKYVPRGTPLVLTWHGPFYSSFKKGLKEFIIKQMTHYDKVIFSSDEYKKAAIKAGLPKEKAKVIHPIANTNVFKPISVDKEKIKEEYGIPKNSKMLFCAQRIDWRSSHKQLIKAMKKIVKEVPNSVLVFAGDKSMSQKMDKSRESVKTEIKKLIKKSGLSEKVFFIGNIDYFKLPKIYNTADVVVSTPKMEAFGLSVTEGMSCGKPIIGNKVGGIPIQVKDNVNGYLVEVGDVDKTAKKAIDLLKDKELRKKMGSESLDIIDKNFTIESKVEEHLQLYKKLLKEKSDMWRLDMFEKKEVEAIITDLDGTLNNYKKEINPTVIKKLKSLNKPLILVTGRHLDYVKKLHQKWKAWDVIVAENGAIVYFPEEDRIISVESENIKKVRETIKKSDIKCHFGKIIISSKIENKDRLKKILKPFNQKLNYELNVDEVMILPKDTNKATGTLLALHEKEIDPKKTILIGDAENDINMFNVPGYKIAVANAHKKLKNVADEHTEKPSGKGVVEVVNKLNS